MIFESMVEYFPVGVDLIKVSGLLFFVSWGGLELLVVFFAHLGGWRDYTVAKVVSQPIEHDERGEVTDDAMI